MDQYYPVGQVNAEKFPELCRCTTRHEVRDVFAIAPEVGLYRFDERCLVLR